MHKVYKPGEEPADYNFEEMCPHCDEQIPVVIDDGCFEYKTTCPVCGKPLMLCGLCRMDYMDGFPLAGYRNCGQNCWEDLARREGEEKRNQY